MEDKIIVLQRFDNYLQANTVKSRLESQGIECFLSDEKVNPLRNSFYIKTSKGVRLHVYEKDKELSKIILKLDESLKPDHEDGLITCPHCSSLNVSFSTGIRKRLSFPKKISVAMLKIYPFRAKKLYHCFDCGFEFKIKAHYHPV